MTVNSTECPRFFQLLRADISATSLAQMLYRILSRTGFFAVFMFRLASSLYVRGGKIGRILGVIVTRANTTLTGCDIEPIAKIGPGFFLPHSVGVVIGPATIGSNVTIFQGVTLAREHSEPGSPPYPTVEDDVVIYTGACVLGGVTIGKGARIGANAVVLCDVPPGALAVGVPARIIMPKQMQMDSATQLEI